MVNRKAETKRRSNIAPPRRPGSTAFWCPRQFPPKPDNRTELGGDPVDDLPTWERELVAADLEVELIGAGMAARA